MTALTFCRLVEIACLFALLGSLPRRPRCPACRRREWVETLYGGRCLACRATAEQVTGRGDA